MAATYTVAFTAVAFASGKSMGAIVNGSGSGRVVRIYRIWVMNNQTAAVTGVLTSMSIRRITYTSGGTTATPVKHDTQNESIPAQIICYTGATVSAVSTLRIFAWSNDEAAVGTGTWDEMETMPPLTCVWDSGYGDTNVQPITLREGEALDIYHIGTSTVGNCDIYIEFTTASS